MVRITLGLWMLVSLSIVAMAADICPNFTGRFVIQGEDGDVHLTITQTACDRIRIGREASYLGKITSEQHDLKLDGEFQVDTPWFGGTDKIQTSVKFTSAALEIVAKPAAATNRGEFLWKALYVTKGDIVVSNADHE